MVRQGKLGWLGGVCGIVCGLFLLLLGACGGPSGEAPYVRSFRFSGQDTADPQTFYFEINWTDNQGDLILLPEQGTPTNGSLLFTVQDLDKKEVPKEVPIPITPLMMSKVGDLEGVMTKIGVAINADTWPARIKFSLVMTDAKGNRSNNPWVIVQTNK